MAKPKLTSMKSVGGNSDFYKTKDLTKEVIRILPLKDDEPIARAVGEVFLNGKPFIDPEVTHNEKSPIMEAYNRLSKSSKKGDKELAQKIKPRVRYWVKAVIRSTGKVVILPLPSGCYKPIYEAFKEDEMDISDAKKGCDVRISAEGAGFDREYSARVLGQSPLAKSDKEASKLIAAGDEIDFDALLTYDIKAIKAELARVIGSDDAEDEDDEETDDEDSEDSDDADDEDADDEDDADEKPAKKKSKKTDDEDEEEESDDEDADDEDEESDDEETDDEDEEEEDEKPVKKGKKASKEDDEEEEESDDEDEEESDDEDEEDEKPVKGKKSKKDADEDDEDEESDDEDEEEESEDDEEEEDEKPVKKAAKKKVVEEDDEDEEEESDDEDDEDEEEAEEEDEDEDEKPKKKGIPLPKRKK